MGDKKGRPKKSQKNAQPVGTQKKKKKRRRERAFLSLSVYT
jgi:hypothetical protein